jgi:RHS repeat-associated protein
MKQHFNLGLTFALAILVAAVGITHPQPAWGDALTVSTGQVVPSAAETGGSTPGEVDAAQRLGRVARLAQAFRDAEADGQPYAELERLADEMGQAVVGLGPIEYLFAPPDSAKEGELDRLSDEMRSQYDASEAEMSRRLAGFRERANALHTARLQGDRAGMVVLGRALANILKGQDFSGGHKILNPESVKRVVAKRIDRQPAMTRDALDALLRSESPKVEPTSSVQMMSVGAQADAVPIAGLNANEATVSPRILALAEQLGKDPIRIYNWVHDHIRFTPTHGSLRGADQTLVARQGNAYDTNALLLALLRASGYQARYVYGTVQVPIDQVQNWVGNAHTPDDALELMLTGGIPTRYMTSGGRISALQFEHVWVEAYVDFIPSRGVIERQPDTWVPLDASFKQYRYDAPLKLIEGTGWDAQRVVEQFISTATIGQDGSVTGLDREFYGNQINAYTSGAASFLESAAPNADIESVFGRQAVVPSDDEWLAGTLPYKVVARSSAYDSLPDSLKNFLVINRYNTRTDYALESPTMTLRIPTHTLGGNSVFVDYEAATQDQQEALRGYAERNDATLPLAAFDVRPVIWIGDAVVRTDAFVDMGTMQMWTAGIVDAHGRGAFGFEPHEYAAGSRISFTPNLGGISPELFDDFVQPLPDTVNLSLAKGLHFAGLQYWYMSDLMGQLSARGWGGSFLRRPSVGAFAAPLQVTYFFGIPRTGFFAGYSTDIKSDNLAVALGDPRKRSLMLLQFGTQASLNESLTWDILLSGQPGYSMSAASMLLRANDLKVPIHTITQETIAQILPKLQLSEFAEHEIAQAVASGLIAVAPEREVADTRQAGVGYVLLDPVSGGGVFRVDGGLNGAINVGCVVRAVSLKLLCDSKIAKILTRRLARWGARMLAGFAIGAILGPVALPAIAVVSAVLITVEIVMTVIEVVQWLQEVMNGIRDLTSDEMAELGISALNEAICSYTPMCFGGPLVGAAMSGLGDLGDAVSQAFGPGAGGNGQGNPITPDRGYKYQTETDYVGTGPFPITFERRYVSYLPNGGPLGHKWASRYFSRIKLAPDAAPNVRPDAVLAARGDGALFQFIYRNGAYVIGGDIPEKLERTSNFFGHTTGWIYTTGLDEVETYDADGRLVEIRNRAGLTQSLDYNDKGQLVRVTDDVGRFLSFDYDPVTGQVTQMRDPQGRAYQYAYDEYGSLVKVTYPGGLSRQYHYELEGRGSLLTGITDERGIRYVSWKYDSQNRAIESSKAGGVETYRLSFGNQQTAVTDPYRATRTFQFRQIRESLYVSSVTEPCSTCGSGSASNYEYDANGYPTLVKDFKGNVTTMRFNARGLPTAITLASGTSDAQASAMEWHTAWRVPIRVTQPSASGGSVVTTFTYNSQGLPETRTVTAEGASRVWRYTYNHRGQIETENGPRTDVDDITRYDYDEQGDLSTVTDPNGLVTRYTEYDAGGKLLAMVDPNGTTTRYGYDERDRLTSTTVIAPGATTGEVTLYDFDGAGHLTGLRLPDGSALSYGYDDAGRLVSVHDTLGNHIAYTLNSAGDRVREDSFDPNSALSQALSRRFNTLGRMTAQHGADPEDATHYGYDDNGNETSMQAPLHAKASAAGYDALNRLIASIDPLEGQVGYRYDARDNLRQVIDPRGLTTTYGYNGFNELVSLKAPDTGGTDYAYDAAGNLLRRKDARGVTADYRYDAANRLTGTTYPDETLSYTHDEAAGGTGAMGRLTTLSDGSGSTRYAYDAHGRVIGKSQQLGADTNTAGRKALGQAWSDGQRTGLSLPSGAQVAYRYNTDGRVKEILVNGRVIVSEVDYFLFGEAKGWTTPAGRYQRGFDRDGRVGSYTWAGQGTALRYDLAGRITQQGDWSYGYDDADRLTAATRTGQSQTWKYDLTGNRTEQIDGATVTGYTIEETSNRLSSVAGNAHQYDAAGNTTYADGRTFVYSGRNRMVEVKQGVLTLARYAYNGVGERVCVAQDGGSCPTATSNGSNYHQYVYDDDGHLVGEYDSSGNLTAEYLWLGDTPVAVLKPVSTAAAFGGTEAGDVAVYYVHPDHLDTPRTVVNAANVVVWSWDSDPFGTTPANENPNGLGAFGYGLRFPGQQYDATTGLHYNYFRDYHAGSGRYVQSDPIGLDGGLGTYTYVQSLPTYYSDPWGLSPLTPILRLPGTLNRKRDRRASNEAIVTCECNSKTVADVIGKDPVPHMKSGKGGLRNPPGTTYHHPEEYLDEVWLVKECDHRAHHRKRKKGGIALGGGK